MFVAEASELPWAVYCPYPPPFRSDDVPPHGLGLRPARGPLGKARDLMVRKFGDRQLAPELAQFNDLRADLGLPTVHKFDDQFLKSDLFIAFTAEPYEYHRSDWPAAGAPRRARPVGAAGRSARLAGSGEPSDRARHRLDRFQLDAKLIATALEALAGEDLAVVATTAAQDPAQFHVPANARVEQFLPHGPILARASCVVCHGGQGITQKSLAAGVPVCVVPFSRDQFDVARRVELNDAGVRLHHKRLNPERLRAAVHTAITQTPRRRTHRRKHSRTPAARPRRLRRSKNC